MAAANPSISHPKFRHGHAQRGKKTPTYRTWRSMIFRCYPTTAKVDPDYAGKGITVCDRWRHDFPAFLADMGERPEGTSIDRIDNSLGYFKENCRWSSANTQARNRSGRKLVEYRGEKKLLVEWCEILGANYKLTRERLLHGWSLDRAFFTDKMTAYESSLLARVGHAKYRARKRQGSSSEPTSRM